MHGGDAERAGGEYQAVAKDDPDLARICLAFPDIYDIGMSHLGTKILYSLLNRAPDIACERAFAPWLDMEAELRARGLIKVAERASAARHYLEVVRAVEQVEDGTLAHDQALRMKKDASPRAAVEEVEEAEEAERVEGEEGREAAEQGGAPGGATGSAESQAGDSSQSSSS